MSLTNGEPYVITHIYKDNISMIMLYSCVLF